MENRWIVWKIINRAKNLKQSMEWYHEKFLEIFRANEDLEKVNSRLRDEIHKQDKLIQECGNEKNDLINRLNQEISTSEELKVMVDQLREKNNV